MEDEEQESEISHIGPQDQIGEDQEMTQFQENLDYCLAPLVKDNTADLRGLNYQGNASKTTLCEQQRNVQTMTPHKQFAEDFEEINGLLDRIGELVSKH